MSAMAFQITGNSIVCSTVCSDVHQISKLRITDHLCGEPPVTGGFPAQRVSNAEKKLSFHDIIMARRVPTSCGVVKGRTLRLATWYPMELFNLYKMFSSTKYGANGNTRGLRFA